MRTPKPRLSTKGAARNIRIWCKPSWHFLNKVGSLALSNINWCTAINVHCLAVSEVHSRKQISPRITGNVENYLILWVTDGEDKNVARLRRAVNFVHVLDNSSVLVEFLTGCVHERVILLISSGQARSIMDEIHSQACLQSVYLLSRNDDKPHWIKQYPKIVGIYKTLETVGDHLLKSLPRVTSTLASVVMAAKDEKSNDAFMYSRLLNETMLCTDDESDLKKDLIAFCRLQYADNQDEIDAINDFEKNSSNEKMIEWYLRDCFLSKVLSRALRTQEIDLIFKMRHAMQCLDKQIKKAAVKETINVYAILELTTENAQTFQNNIGGLLLFGAFLSATLERPSTGDFKNTNERALVTFSIRLGSDCGALVKNLRPADCKTDVLINVDTIFRVLSVDKHAEGLWNVSLESVKQSDGHFRALTDEQREAMKAPVVILQLTKLLIATDHYPEGDYITELVFIDGSFFGDNTLLASLAASHHLLGNVDDERGDSEAARNQFFKSLRAFKKFLPETHPLLSSSYNNIGSMYYKDDKYAEAIEFHEKALDCQLKSPSPDTDAVSIYSANIGAVYFEKKDYGNAVKHLQRAVKIIEKTAAGSKVDTLVNVYQKIASCFWRTDKPKEALEYYLKTLKLQLNAVPQDIHSISVTYFNLSTAYASIGDLNMAVESAEKSIEQLLKIRSDDHDEVKENRAQLESVRQKQWLQQVLNDQHWINTSSNSTDFFSFFLSFFLVPVSYSF